MTQDKNFLPQQPYLVLEAADYKGLAAQRAGIASFYEFTVQKKGQGQFVAVPDGSTDLVFGIGADDVRLYVGGTVLCAKQWEFEPGRTYFGVRFAPGKCILPNGLSIREIVNADLELDKNAFGGRLAERIASALDIKERAHIFLQYITEMMCAGTQPDTKEAIERYVRSRIYETGGTVSVRELGQETGYSECYIRRSFEQVHGIPPKVFEKFVRFQKLLSAIHARPDLAKMEELALDCGYYDQSHMMKDFKMFTGITPECYRSRVLGQEWKFKQDGSETRGGKSDGIIKN